MSLEVGSGSRGIKLPQVDVNLICQYFINVYKDHHEFHGPSGEESGWGTAGPAFPVAQVSYQLAAGQCLNVASSREERLRRHWLQEPFRNSFAPGCLELKFWMPCGCWCSYVSRILGQRKWGPSTFPRAGLRYDLGTQSPEDHGASHHKLIKIIIVHCKS